MVITNRFEHHSERFFMLILQKITLFSCIYQKKVVPLRKIS